MLGSPFASQWRPTTVRCGATPHVLAFTLPVFLARGDGLGHRLPGRVRTRARVLMLRAGCGGKRKMPCGTGLQGGCGCGGTGEECTVHGASSSRLIKDVEMRTQNYRKNVVWPWVASVSTLFIFLMLGCSGRQPPPLGDFEKFAGELKQLGYKVSNLPIHTFEPGAIVLLSDEGLPQRPTYHLRYCGVPEELLRPLPPRNIGVDISQFMQISGGVFVKLFNDLFQVTVSYDETEYIRLKIDNLSAKTIEQDRVREYFDENWYKIQAFCRAYSQKNAAVVWSVAVAKGFRFSSGGGKGAEFKVEQGKVFKKLQGKNTEILEVKPNVSVENRVGGEIWSDTEVDIAVATGSVPTVETKGDFQFDEEDKERYDKIRSTSLDYPGLSAGSWKINRELYFVWFRGKILTINRYIGNRISPGSQNEFVVGFYKESQNGQQKNIGLIYNLKDEVEVKPSSEEEFRGSIFYKVAASDEFDLVHILDSGESFCKSDKKNDDYMTTGVRFAQNKSFKVGIYTDKNPPYIKPFILVGGPSGKYLEAGQSVDNKGEELRAVLKKIPKNHLTDNIPLSEVKVGKVFDFSDRRFKDIVGLQVSCR